MAGSADSNIADCLAQGDMGAPARGRMISIRKYLDGTGTAEPAANARIPLIKKGALNLLPTMVKAYGGALSAMGQSSQDACPALGTELEKSLAEAMSGLVAEVTEQSIVVTNLSVREHLANWGRMTAKHYQEKADEVKAILMAMAETVESVGQRDQRCTVQINEVTARLKTIASLEDLDVIRASISKSATDLKESFDRISAEGKAVLEKLEAQVTTYQVKLEAAEQMASRDSLTGLRNRLWVEGEIERKIVSGAPFCGAILDMDDFKSVNDAHGHLAGDDLLRQFATELRSASRSTDVIGRWGGDEFILLLECEMSSAEAQIERLAKWVCGSYKIESTGAVKEIAVNASIGLAEHRAGETMKELLDRADAAMYERKAAAHASVKGR